MNDRMTDAAEMLWVVLANVSGGDWTKQSTEWQEAAARWRDNYFAALKADRLAADAGTAARVQEPMTELLESLDELYPLPDDDKRAERGGRTAAVLKRWIQRETIEIEKIAQKMLEAHRAGAPVSPPCRVCGGSGFVAQKQFLDDGYGEVDSCPACAAPVFQEDPQ